MSEQLRLEWTDFRHFIGTSFTNLREDLDFSDVTLACEDGKLVEAHKVVLAASSPFFQSLLRRNKHPHPLIYMRGVKSEDLVAIVDFLYCGEANVYQESLDTFMAIAEELGLKGLSGNVTDKEAYSLHLSRINHESAEEVSQTPEPVASDKVQPLSDDGPDEKEKYTEEQTSASRLMEEAGKVKSQSEPPVENGFSFDTPSEKTDDKTDKTHGTQIKELDDKIQSLMVIDYSVITDGSRKTHICKVCGKEGRGTDVKRHIETNHIEGVSIPCPFCEKRFRARNSLVKHKLSKHRS